MLKQPILSSLRTNLLQITPIIMRHQNRQGRYLINTLMLAGGSSNVNNIYLSPRLSEDRCLTYIIRKKKLSLKQPLVLSVHRDALRRQMNGRKG